MVKRFLGSSVTDSNGRATLPYTGSGRGLVDFVAEVEVDDSTLSSEIYETLDCIVYDDFENTTYQSKYSRDNTANISYSTEWSLSGSKSMKWDCQNLSGNNSYWGIVFITNPSSSAFDIELVKGQTIRFEIDTNASVGSSTQAFTIVAYVKTTTNTSWSQIGAKALANGENHNIFDLTIPNNATQFWLRFGSVGNDAKTLYVDNWKLYPI